MLRIPSIRCLPRRRTASVLTANKNWRSLRRHHRFTSNAITRCASSCVAVQRYSSIHPLYHNSKRQVLIRHFASLPEAVPESTTTTTTSDDATTTKQSTTVSLSSFSSSPLGSLTATGWDDALTAIMSNVDKAMMDTGNEAQSDAETPPQHQAATQQQGAIYWMNRGDKLLARLQAEFATQSFASRSRATDLRVAQLTVLQAWCHTGRVLMPDHRLTVERAGRIFWSLVGARVGQAWWKSAGDDDEHRMVLMNSFLDLLEMYARKDYLSHKDLEQATRLLLWNDLPAMGLDASEIGPMFGILTQQVQMLEDENTLQLLQEQWNKVSNEDLTQWFLQSPEEQQQSEADDSSLLDLNLTSEGSDGNTTTVDRSLSSFESERMIQQTIVLLERGNPADHQRIENVISQWENLIATGATQPNNVVNVILDYYARSGDTTNAIKWLARLDLTNPTDLPKGLNQLLISLAEKDDPSAIWRAEEILRQLESSGGGNSLDPAAYAAVAERWLKTNESQAGRRVMELCFRPDKFNPQLVSVLLRGLRREKELSANLVNQILEWFTKQNDDSIEVKSRRELVEGLLFVLQRHGKDWQAWELFQSEMEKGLEIDNKLCELVVASIPNRAEPNDVIKLFRFFENKNLELGIGFFLEASRRLADFQKKERLDQLVILTNAVLERVRNGSIDAKDSSLSFFFKSIFEFIIYFKRDDIALYLLNRMEAVLQTSIPMYCYSATAHSLDWNGRLRSLKVLYRRLKKMFDSGQTNMHPDAKFYLHFVRVLATASQSDSSRIHTILDEQSSLLDELREHYISSGDAQYKPLPGMYKTLLSTITGVKPTEPIAAKAESLVNEMISIGAVDANDADPFSMSMHAILGSPRMDEYESVVSMWRNMRECGVKESDFICVNLLRACTRTRGKEQQAEAVKVTLEILKKFRESNLGSKPSSQGPRVYSLAFASILRNLSQGDPNVYPILDQIFKACREDGYVTPRIVGQLRKDDKVSKSFFQRFYNDQLLYGGVEPEEWSRNVPRD